MAYNTQTVVFKDGKQARCEIRQQGTTKYIIYKKDIWVVEYSETVSIGWNHASHIYKVLRKAELV